MPNAVCILVIDASPADTALTEFILSRALPAATVLAAHDAIGFAEVLTAREVDLTIVAAPLAWAPADKLLALLRRRRPQTRVLLFAQERELVELGAGGGLAIDGFAPKSSAGYLALAGLTRDILERAGISLPTTPPSAGQGATRLPLDTLPLGAFVAGEDGVIGGCNDDFAHALSQPRERLLGCALDTLLTDADAAGAWRALRAGSEDTCELGLRIGLRAHVRRVHGALAAERFLGCLLPGAAASTQTFAGTEAPSQEMRDLALVFSHDLKEPVQQIARIAQRGDDPGDPTLHSRSLQQILECASRASGMLDSMLQYLSVSAHTSAPARVDLNHCVEQALDNLRGAVDEADAQVTVTPLPTIVGDEYQLQHLFQNLLSNAIKFRGRERPEIRVSAELQDGDWLLSVRDNGIGISPQFAQRVFEMGQRLHTRDEYPGTGVGLALCKRIAERHGGRVWVTTNDDGGSTFCVRLPQSPSHITRQT